MNHLALAAASAAPCSLLALGAILLCAAIVVGVLAYLTETGVEGTVLAVWRVRRAGEILRVPGSKSITERTL